MSLPAALRVAPELALARPAFRLPTPGGDASVWMEPKWDGYRVAIVRDEDGARLWSRQGKELTVAFPEISAAAVDQIPPGCVVDGELVMWSSGRLVFDELQRRMASRGRRAEQLMRELPASFVAFDVLAVADRDIRHHALSVRRMLLDELAVSWRPPLSLSPGTTDTELAFEWFDSMADAGIEGVVVKPLDGAYSPGQRAWVKVKRRETVDVVVGAVIGPLQRPEAVVVGIHVDGTLRIAGRSTPLTARAAQLLGELLQAPVGEHPWPAVVKRGAVDRFNAGREPVALTLVQPIVAEVSADAARSGYSFRHAVRFLRPRPDLDPREVTTQLDGQ